MIRTALESLLLAHLTLELVDVMRILAQVHLVVICSKLRHMLVLEVSVVVCVLISKLHVLVLNSRMGNAVVILVAIVTHGSWSCVSAASMKKLRHRHVEFDGLRVLQSCVGCVFHLNVVRRVESWALAHFVCGVAIVVLI